MALTNGNVIYSFRLKYTIFSWGDMQCYLNMVMYILLGSHGEIKNASCSVGDKGGGDGGGRHLPAGCLTRIDITLTPPPPFFKIFTCLLNQK